MLRLRWWCFAIVFHVVGCGGDGPRVDRSDAGGGASDATAGRDAAADAAADAGTAGQAPDTSLTGQPAALGNVASISIGLVSSVTPATFECNLDGAGFAACTSPFARALTDGAHTFQARATAGGLTDATPVSISFTIDTVPSDTTIATGPSGDSTSAEATFTFTATEPGTFECKVDNGAFAACSATLALTGLSVGAHTVEVRAVDGAGNRDASPATRTWTIVAAGTAPNTTIVSGPDALGNEATVTFVFAADPSAGASFECSLDGAAFAACTTPRVDADLDDGEHTFRVRAKNGVGTDATPASATFTVDTTGALASITGHELGCGTVTLTADTDPPEEGATFECAALTEDREPTESEYLPCDPAGTVFPVAPGTFYRLVVRARDGLGNAGPPASFTFTTPGAPMIVITAPVGTTTNRTHVEFHEAQGLDDVLTFSCTVDDRAAIVPCPSGTEVTGLAPGTHTVVVAASVADCGTAGSASATWTVKNGTMVAIASPTAGPEICPPATFSFDPGTSDHMACTLDGHGVPCSTSGAGQFGPFTEHGPHTLVVTGYDAAGQVVGTDSVDFTVDAALPVVDVLDRSNPGGTCPAGEVAFACSPVDDDLADCESTHFECVLDGGEVGPCTSPYVYAALPEGLHELGIRAYDRCGRPGPFRGVSFGVDEGHTPGWLSTFQWRNLSRVQRTIDVASNDAHAPRLAQNASGDAVAVWLQDNMDFGRSRGRHVYAAELLDGEWSTPRRLDPFPRRGDRTLELGFGVPQVAMNDAGQVLVAWSAEDCLSGKTCANRVYVAERDRIGEWSLPSVEEFVSNDVPGGNAGMPFVAINASGQALVTWVESRDDTDSAVVYVRQRGADGEWSLGNQPLSPDPVFRAGAWVGQWHDRQAALALDDDGNALVAWEQDDHIYLARRNADLLWTMPLSLEDTVSPEGGHRPALAQAPNGEAVLVWATYSGGGLTAIERPAKGTFGSPISLVGFGQGSAFADQFAVAINAGGQVVVPYSDTRGNILTAERVGGKWTTALVWANPDDADDADYPYEPAKLAAAFAVAENTAGEVVLAWRTSSVERFRPTTYVAERNGDGKWSEYRELTYTLDEDNGTGSKRIISPITVAVGMNDDGEAQAVWLQDGPGAARWANHRVFAAWRARDEAWVLPDGYDASLSTPQEEGLSAGQNSGFRLVANRQRQALAVWSQYVGDLTAQVSASERDVHGVWHELGVFSAPGTFAAEVDAAINDQGQAVVVWRESDGQAGVVYRRERGSDGIWGKVEAVDFGFEVDPFYRAPHVAIDGAGRAIIVYGNAKVERSVEGVWQGSPTGLVGYAPRVAMNDAGQAVIVDWQSGVDETAPKLPRPVEFRVVYTVERDASGKWGEKRLISPGLLKVCSLYGENAYEGLKLAMNRSGEVVVVYGAYGGAWLSERDAKGTWTLPPDADHPIIVAGNEGACGITVDVAQNELGEAVVAWEQRTQTELGTRREVEHAYRDDEGVWTRPATPLPALSGPDTRNSATPHVALNLSGQAIIQWTQGRGYGGMAWTMAAVRDASGQPFPAAPAPWRRLGEDTSGIHGIMQPILWGCGEAMVGVYDPRVGMSVIDFR